MAKNLLIDTSKLDALNKPYKIYAEFIEPSALTQFEEAMKLDSVVRGALMPDTHIGYSLPIGCVVACSDMIYPSFVGFDIGCGMCALPTSFNIGEIEQNRKAIFDEIYKYVPVGFAVHQHPIECDLNPEDLTELGREAFDKRRGFRGIGTLGGGNHFIELGKDEAGMVWVIIHSGSRGVGHGIASEYIRLADPSNKVRDGLLCFRTDCELGLAYLNDMGWALDYALVNR